MTRRHAIEPRGARCGSASITRPTPPTSGCGTSRTGIRCSARLAEHPAALALVRGTLGWPALLSNISANITGPGGGEMVLHADQLYMPQPWSGIQGINVLWCLDDFTDENGATRYVPGSHERNRAPTAEDQGADTRRRSRRRLVRWWRWRVGCGTRRATTARPTERRAGVFAWYTTPIYRPQENWFLALDDQVVDTASDDLLVLLGYRAIGLGLVNGASPR